MPPVTIDTIRAEMQAIRETLPVAEMTSEQWDQISAATAEMLIACTIDPADRSAIRGFLCGSFAALNHIINSPLTVGIALPFTFIQTELALRWHDGAQTVLSIADLLGLKDTLDLPSPTCDASVAWPTTNRSSPCTLALGHDGSHSTTAIAHVDGRDYTYEVGQ